MLEQFRSISKTKESIDGIKTDMDALRAQVAAISSSMEEMRITNSIMTKQYRVFLKEIHEGTKHLDEIKRMRADIERELYEFRLLRGQVQKRIMEHFEEELKKELRINLDTIQQETKRWDSLHHEFAKIQDAAGKFTSETERLLAISKNIRKEDFELTKFSQELKRTDAERVRLLQQLESAQRLISALRRHAQPRQSAGMLRH